MPTAVIDGAEAVTSVAYRLSEAIAIYPITPSTPLGELADAWSARRRPNVWGDVPSVTEMQSEGGAAGAAHGAIQAGALGTTFTASQGLLLMIPNMYKIAGELTPFVMHVAARTVATHALSIFGDHSDVMACRQTGFALLSSASVQEAQDLALVAHAATLESRVPFLHFFDGFRTSHEIAKIETLDDDDLRWMIDDDHVRAHRERALTPDRPVIRGTAQNPDTFFQAREASNRFHDRVPAIVQKAFERFEERTGRRYGVVEYHGAADADRVIVLMGSGVETVRATVEALEAAGEKVGVVAVRLYRPFPAAAFLGALPPSARRIAVLDRTKEPGAVGDPLFLDVATVLRDAERAGTSPLAEAPLVVGGRYGLSSKEFTPAMVKGVLDELASDAPKPRFTIGIVDDVTHRSIAVDPSFDIEPEGVVRAVFYGLGSDGTVGANKNSIKIIAGETENFGQGYFVYDSRKAGAVTISHLRFGPEPIHAPYLVRSAGFVACHHFPFLDDLDVLDLARPGATFLLNAPYGPDEIWNRLPREVQAQILEKRLSLYVIDAARVAHDVGMGRRINTIMQTCFFAISGVLPRDEAIGHIKAAIEKTYGKKGEEIVKKNWEAVDAALDHLHEVPLPGAVTAEAGRPPVVPDGAPDFLKTVTAVMLEGKGDLLPVSAFPVDGTWPTGTTQWEKRNIAYEIPIWEPDICIQCSKCAFVCPHAAIRAKVYEPAALERAPEAFRSIDYRWKDIPDSKYTIQVAPEDCTGCSLCVQVCPAKDKGNPRRKAINMREQLPRREEERGNYAFFLDLPDADRSRVEAFDVKSSQLMQPLFEYSGACAGCGETPYLKLLSQMYGDRLLVANATGCSSIYGGNLPTTPWRRNADGRGPAWSNSLFEDNAEFGLGFRLAVCALMARANRLLLELAPELPDTLVDGLVTARPYLEREVQEQRARVRELEKRLAGIDRPQAMELAQLAAYLVPKSIWLVGGDGWAYDIGYGGLDHVLSMRYDVNILVLDTEVYSNTGGQASKATPLGAAAKFAASGKPVTKKDLGLMALSYGHVYVAAVSWGARDQLTVKAFQEAHEYDGPSLILANSPCIAHGYDLALGGEQQKKAVSSGMWPLYRYDPRRAEAGEPPLVLDAPMGKTPVLEYMQSETRFRMVEKQDPKRFREFAVKAQEAAARRVAAYKHIAELRLPATAGARGNAGRERA